MIPTTWARRAPEVSSSFPNFIQSISVGEEFRSSPSPTSRKRSLEKSVYGTSGLVSPLNEKVTDRALSEYDSTPTKETHDESNLDHQPGDHPGDFDDPTMIHPIPITPDTITTTTTTTFTSPSSTITTTDDHLNCDDHKSGNRWSKLRVKTAAKLRTAVEQSRQAETLGATRTRQEHHIQKQKFIKKQQRSSAASTGSLSLHGIDELSNHNTNDATTYPTYKPPTSSCDGDVRSVGSGGSNHRETSIAGTIMNAARTVDRKRTVERNRAAEAAASDRAALSALATVAEVSRRKSTNLAQGNVPFLNMSDHSISSSDNGNLSDQIPFTEVKRRMADLRKENRQLGVDRGLLRRQLDNERQESLMMLKQARKEVEERNLKLAVLEQHFIALNEHTAQDSDSVIESGGPSFDSSDTSPTKEANKSPQDDNLSHKSHQDDSISHKSSSIIRLDKSYLANLKKNYKESQIELAQLKHENAERHTVKAEMMRQLEDLSERLRCRETTISSLDQALKQMRAARFKQKASPKKSHRRRATANSIPIISVGLPPTTETSEELSLNESTKSISTLNESTKSLNSLADSIKTSQPSEAIIAEAVNNALDIKGKENALIMAIMQEKLDKKDVIIKRLNLKNTSMKNLKNMGSSGRMNGMSGMNGSTRNFSSTRSLLTANSQGFNARNMSISTEVMNTLTLRLENMLTKIDAPKQNQDEVQYDTGFGAEDELAPIRKIAAKISLVNDEMKVSMKIIEQKMMNEFELIKIFHEKNILDTSLERSKSAGQHTSSGDSCSPENSTNATRTSQLNVQIEEVEGVQERTAKLIQEAESSIGKNIKELKDQIQGVELGMESKQDMIEALELACSEHDRNCRSLQEQMSALVLRLEERADQESGVASEPTPPPTD